MIAHNPEWTIEDTKWYEIQNIPRVGQAIREDLNKKRVKWVTFIKKGGWGQNFMKTNFFFAIVT